ncbi:unnamed protein product, partial [Staurois parvus]
MSSDTTAASTATLRHVPLSGLLTTAARSRVCHGSLYGLPLLLTHRQTLPCATFRSPYTVGGFHFVIGCC